MQVMIIFLILLNYLGLSFQIIQSALFCDDRIQNIYVYNESTRSFKFLLKVKDPKDCFNPDYIDLDVDPGALIKFECSNGASDSLGGGCFLINNHCKCYDFNVVGYIYDYFTEPRPFKVKFNNDTTCEHKAKFIKGKEYTTFEFYHSVPLDTDEIKCIPKNISAPINIKNSLKFSEFIEYPYNLTYLKISVIQNWHYFTLNNQSIYQTEKFNILSDLEYFSRQSSKIFIKFRNYGVTLDFNKECEFNIRFCYNSCLECNDIDPNETFHQCSKCKDDFYKIENTTNCMTKNQMEDNHSYYFDRKEEIFRLCYHGCSKCDNIEPNETSHQCSECQDNFYKIENTSNCMTKKEMENSNYFYDEYNKIFRQCHNECSACLNESFCSKCSEGYHFMNNEKGKCIKEEDNIAIIIIIILTILIIIIALFFFIKRCASRKKLENEISNTLEKNSSDNQLINVLL